MIDVVITWVDGNDPRLAAKRRAYATGTAVETHDDVAGATRYAADGEIHWCVRSIERFAPWVRKIFIVTDGQNPQVRTDRIPVEIIDHKVIFRGYEQYLPTFNSRTIETMLWRIPGLSDRYIYLNDDFAFINPVEPADFFDSEGRPVVYGYRHSTLTARLGRLWDRVRSPRHRKVKFRDGMLNAALELGLSEFYRLQHVPHGIRRDVLERWFREHPESLVSNISHRFRSAEQFNPQELQYLLCGSEVRDHRPVLIYIEPAHPEIAAKAGAKFFCVNSLDQFSPEGKALVRQFLENRFDG
ncbi:MAG: Stealth CR1 domain-containing protein [Muribaculaceae bacterium]|nr:Stealth CR1 domain-containing protein [Muribaculaceae bacterium]